MKRTISMMILFGGIFVGQAHVLAATNVPNTTLPSSTVNPASPSTPSPTTPSPTDPALPQPDDDNGTSTPSGTGIDPGTGTGINPGTGAGTKDNGISTDPDTTGTTINTNSHDSNSDDVLDDTNTNQDGISTGE